MSSSSDSGSCGSTIFLLIFLWLVFGDGCSLSKKECTSCLGTGKVNCTWCYGSGEKTCRNCNGKGKKEEYIPTILDNGYQYVNYNGHSGYVYVWGSHYADFPCRDCSETGKVACDDWKCKGTGKKECSSCNGKGEK